MLVGLKKTNKKLGIGIILALAISLPLFIWAVIKQNLEIREQAASCVEQCPGSDGVLRNCHPPELDGSSQDSVCNVAGRIEFCGTTNFCCPVAGGSWTTNLTLCPTPSPTPTATPSSTPTIAPTPTSTPILTCNSLAPGDVDGNGVVNIVDLGIIIDNYAKLPIVNLCADVNGDGIVNIVDVGILIDNYGFGETI